MRSFKSNENIHKKAPTLRFRRTFCHKTYAQTQEYEYKYDDFQSQIFFSKQSW